MRLLHVYAGPFPTSQGTQALIEQTCALLARAGHEVHLLCYAGRQFERKFNFTVHRIADRPRFDQLRSGPKWQKPLLDMALGSQTMRLARALRPDVIAGHHVEALLASATAAKRLKIPLVYHLHALLAPELGTYFPRIVSPAAKLAGSLTDQVCCALADHTIALSHAQARGAATDRLSVVHPPLDASDLAQRQVARSQEDRNVRGAYIGNLDGYQNIHTLVAALENALPRMGGRLRFEFITDSDSAPLQRELAARGLADYVSIAPHGAYESARKRLLRSDFTVIPRVQVGGVPIKLVTALALGLPTIVHNELAEGLQDKDEALLVDMGSSLQLADAICLMTDEPNLRATLAHGARTAARRMFDPQQVAEKLGEIYQTTCHCA